MLCPATTPVRHVVLLVLQFHVRYKCEYGQEVYLVGNCSALGDWDVMKGVQLVWSSGHIWEGSVELPAGWVLGCTRTCTLHCWCLVPTHSNFLAWFCVDCCYAWRAVRVLQRAF